MSTVHVLVVGAGPVGMALALELAMQGVTFRIIEKDATPSTKSRAIGIHSRTLEVFNRYGGVDELLAKSHKIIGNVFWDNGKPYEGFHFPIVLSQEQPQTQFGGMFAISQADTESFLQSHLIARGVTVERGVAVQRIAQDDAAATVHLLKDNGSEETVHAKLVVGCDGAHSIVRHSMDVEFQGDAYKQEFLLADVLIDWDRMGDKVHIMLGDSMLMVLPLSRERARILVSSPAGSSPDDKPRLEGFQAALDERLPAEERPRIQSPFWLSRFRLHHRCSTKYRDGRLFLAGDAAHIHSPVGGQGLNTGIQDSVNLGWKIASVLKGDKPDGFLDTYNEERHPVGQHLLDQTDQMFTFLTSNAPIFISSRAFLLPLALPSLATSDMGLKVMKYFSGLGVKYRRSSIVHTAPNFEGPVRGGFRAPDGRMKALDGQELWLHNLLRGPGYHVLVFAQTAEDEEVEEAATRVFAAGGQGDPSLARLHIITRSKSPNPKAVADVDGELHRRYGFATRPGVVSVRPDGYIESIGYLD